MKANSLEELVTNSNIAGELRNYTDWHTHLVKFAQLVADWQKEQSKVILLKRDTEDIFAREYAIYSLPPFVVESIAYGTQLIDFIYKTAHHFYGRGFRRAAEMYDEIEYNRQRAEEE